MKTILIPTLGWTADEVFAFRSYLKELSRDFNVSIEVIQTVDHYLEVDVEDYATHVQHLIVSSQPSW